MYNNHSAAPAPAAGPAARLLAHRLAIPTLPLLLALLLLAAPLALYALVFSVRTIWDRTIPLEIFASAHSARLPRAARGDRGGRARADCQSPKPGPADGGVAEGMEDVEGEEGREEEGEETLVGLLRRKVPSLFGPGAGFTGVPWLPKYALPTHSSSPPSVARDSRTR